MKWRVEGADRETGKLRGFIITSSSAARARRTAQRQGVVVATVEPANPPPPPPPPATPKPPPRSTPIAQASPHEVPDLLQITRAVQKAGWGLFMIGWGIMWLGILLILALAMLHAASQ